MTNPALQVSQGHVGRSAEALDELITAIDAALAEHRLEHLPYLPESPAAEDSTLAFATHVVDMLGGIGLSYGAILDSASHLADLGNGAYRGEVTPIYAPHSVARSVVELLAQLHWFLEPGLDAKQRMARSLSIRRRDARGALPFGLEPGRIGRIDGHAAALGMRKVGTGSRRGYERELPGYGPMVDGMLGEKMYSLLSGISHGETWALVQLGYSPTEVEVWGGTGKMMRKSAPAYGLWLAVTVVVRALVRAVPRDFIYRGWDMSVLRPQLLSAHKKALDLSVPKNV